MSHFRSHLLTTALAAAMLLAGPAAWAQQGGQNPGWFIPGGGGGAQQRPTGQPQPQQQQRPPGRPPGQAAAPTQPPGAAAEGMAPGGEGGLPIPMQQLMVTLPPAPEVPAIPKGASPPAAIIGVLSIQDVLRISTAYQQADKEIGTRRMKLNEDAQKEQIALRDLGQAFANERAKLTPDQIRQKERDYQQRVNDSRRKFGDRNRIIQESGQYAMAQIDRMLEQVAQQVALSRGINLVLNRAQLLGTTAEFDITAQVAEVLNQVLPAVVIPPDGVSPLAMAPPQGEGDKTVAQPASGTKPPQKN